MVYEAPQTRERVRGREAYRFNAEGFPGDWHVAVQRIVSQDHAAASMIEYSEGGTSQSGLCFFDLDEDGRIVRITDFWPDPYQPRRPGAPGRPVLRGPVLAGGISAAGPPAGY